MTRDLVRALTAEAIGTFALVFAGCGAVMVDAKTHQLGHVGVAITFRLPLFAAGFLLLLAGIWVNRDQPGANCETQGRG